MLYPQVLSEIVVISAATKERSPVSQLVDTENLSRANTKLIDQLAIQQDYQGNETNKVGLDNFQNISSGLKGSMGHPVEKGEGSSYPYIPG